MYSAHYFCRILITFEFSRQIFEEVSNIKFHKNPSSGSRVLLCRQTKVTKLIVAFRNFAKVPKNRIKTMPVTSPHNGASHL